MIVINKSRRLVAGGLRPVSLESRVIAVRASAAGLGVWGFGYSPSFGQTTRLLQINATVQIVPGGAVERCHFSIHRGSVEPRIRQDVEAWERVIDFGTYAGVHGMVVYGPIQKFFWELNRTFSGEANRFGVLFYNSSTNVGVVHVFFMMSEG